MNPITPTQDPATRIRQLEDALEQAAAMLNDSGAPCLSVAQTLLLARRWTPEEGSAEEAETAGWQGGLDRAAVEAKKAWDFKAPQQRREHFEETVRQRAAAEAVSAEPAKAPRQNDEDLADEAGWAGWQRAEKAFRRNEELRAARTYKINAMLGAFYLSQHDLVEWIKEHL